MIDGASIVTLTLMFAVADFQYLLVIVIDRVQLELIESPEEIFCQLNCKSSLQDSRFLSFREATILSHIRRLLLFTLII